ncbi:MAG TPA: hypothetical protein VHD33_08125 [Legionellaceae bacterium]|nr:hypothetical protein [Legionellaceae bacterium]
MFSQDEETTRVDKFISNRLLALERFVQNHQTTDIEQQFLLDIIKDLLHIEKKIWLNSFGQIPSHKKNHYLVILLEECDLIYIKSYQKDDSTTACSSDELKEWLQNYDKRQPDTSLCNTNAIILHQDQLYHYIRYPSATLNPIPAPSEADKKKKYDDVIKDIKNTAIPFKRTPLNGKQRELIEVSTGLKVQYILRNYNAMMLSMLFDQIDHDVRDIAKVYKELRATAMLESAKFAVIFVGGLFLQSGTQVLLSHMVGHAIPMIKFIIVMQYVLIAGATFLAIGLCLALYCHWQYNHFTQLTTEIHQCINTKKDYITPNGTPVLKETNNRNITYFFHENRNPLNTLLNEAAQPLAQNFS